MPQYIEYRGQKYKVELRRDLAIGDFIPWCIEVAGGCYQLTHDAFDVDDAARQYVLYSLRNPGRLTPPTLASRRYPLLVPIGGITVRAWPQFLPRGTGAKTFVHPKLNARVATERDQPNWMFESAARPASPGGSMTAEQTLDDVVDLAKTWLRGDHSMAKGSINGVAVFGTLYAGRGELRSYSGSLTVGDSDAPKLVAMMTSDKPPIYIGEVSEAGKLKQVKIPVLFSVRMGTAATVVDVQSAGAPLPD